MSTDPHRPGEPVTRGAHLLDPTASARERASRRQRLARFVRRPWVWGTATFTAVSALVAFLNMSLDLVERLDQTQDRSRPPLEGVVNPDTMSGDPDDLVLWNQSMVVCRDQDVDPLIRAPTDRDQLEAGHGELGTGAVSSQAATTSPWVLAEAYDVPASEFDFQDFRAAGAVVVGSRHVEVILSNRRDQDIIITNLTADIERQPPFGGTILRPIGGDPVVVRLLILDLAEEEPVAMTLDDRCEPYPFFARYKLAVEPGQAEILAIATTEADCYCLYRLKIEYWYDGTRHTATVPAEGEEPLVSMGISPSGYDLAYTSSGGDVTRYDCRQEPTVCGDQLDPPD